MNFRRVLTALALIAVFTALASAQGVSVPSMACTATAASNQTIRSEGLNDRVGDLILTCSNVSVTTANGGGNAVDRITVTVTYSAPIANPLGSNVSVGGAVVGKASDIVLLFNDPSNIGGTNYGNGPVANYGQNAAITVCSAANAAADWDLVQAGNNGSAAACPATQLNSGGFWVANNAGVQAANAYQGVVSGSKVTFYDVPWINSASSSVTNTWRVANARVNPTGVSTVTASVAAAVPTNPTTGVVNADVRYTIAASATPTVATSQSGLTPAVANANGISICSSANLALTAGNPNVAILKFTENFGTAFKTRVLPLTAMGGSLATGNGATQLLPNGTYNFDATPALLNIGSTTTPTTTLSMSNSESGLVIAGVGGLASSGTRLKAVFTKLPANMTFYVSLNPVIDFRNQATAPTVGGFTTDKSWAVALGQPPAAGFAAGINIETQAFAAAGADDNVNGIPVQKLVVDANGNAEAVWEVTNVQSGVETFTFAMYTAFNPNVAVPVTGNAATVQLGYAPTTGAATTAAASWIPRFVAPPAGQTFLNVVPCQTSLLFPYITNFGGWETGIAISNTGKDPFNTSGTKGDCTFNFYGTNAPTAAVTFATALDAGSTAVGTASGLGLVNFSGYGIAVCGFQYAHGFVFINDAKQNMAMGYLATVMQDTNRGLSLIGESFGQ